jgi:hypothetical protein
MAGELESAKGRVAAAWRAGRRDVLKETAMADGKVFALADEWEYSMDLRRAETTVDMTEKGSVALKGLVTVRGLVEKLVDWKDFYLVDSMEIRKEQQVGIE